MSQKSRTIKVLKVTGIAIAVLLTLLYIGLPAGMAVFAVLPGRSTVGGPPAGSETVNLTTAEGVQLQGWHRPSENGATILLLHGAGGSRESMRPYAVLLGRHGYGVLAFDASGHGASQGKTNRLGWQAAADIGAALEFLEGRSEVQRIGGLGISMGGEALLGAASTYPQMEAIATDGATHRSIDDLLALESERLLVRNFTARVMYATVGLLTFEPPPKTLVESLAESQTTRFLLIAGGDEAMEIAFNDMFLETLGERAALWIAPGAGHTAAMGLYPQEYEQRVIEFFDGVLLDP